MIFGKTTTPEERLQKRVLTLLRGWPEFAFFPCHLEDGRWAWLEKIWVYYPDEFEAYTSARIGTLGDRALGWRKYKAIDNE